MRNYNVINKKKQVPIKRKKWKKVQLKMKIKSDNISYIRKNVKGMNKMQNIINKIKKMDKKIVRLIDIGQWIFFLVSIVGIIVLLVHYKLYISAELYQIGIQIFKIGIIGVVSVIVCSCGLWIIKEEMHK